MEGRKNLRGLRVSALRKTDVRRHHLTLLPALSQGAGMLGERALGAAQAAEKLAGYSSHCGKLEAGAESAGGAGDVQFVRNTSMELATGHRHAECFFCLGPESAEGVGGELSEREASTFASRLGV